MQESVFMKGARRNWVSCGITRKSPKEEGGGGGGGGGKKKKLESIGELDLIFFRKERRADQNQLPSERREELLKKSRYQKRS